MFDTAFVCRRWLINEVIQAVRAVDPVGAEQLKERMASVSGTQMVEVLLHLDGSEVLTAIVIAEVLIGRGAYPRAVSILRKALLCSDGAIKSRARYNLGVALLKGGVEEDETEGVAILRTITGDRHDPYRLDAVKTLLGSIPPDQRQRFMSGEALGE